PGRRAGQRQPGLRPDPEGVPGGELRDRQLASGPGRGRGAGGVGLAALEGAQDIRPLRAEPMRSAVVPHSRRSFLASALAATAAPAPGGQAPAPPKTAHVAITLDLEMSRHYPTWDQTHWDYEKGNLDADTKRYAVEAARRVRRRE